MEVMPEIAQAVLSSLSGCQSIPFPLVLCGGDVLMVRSLSSAFSIPVIRIVYETLKDQQEGKKGRSSVKTVGAVFNKWQTNPYDRSSAFGKSLTLSCKRAESSTKAVTKGKYYYEVACHDQGLCRVGWSTAQKSHNKQFDSYGENQMEATITDSCLSFTGNDLGLAFEIPPQLKKQPFFASCVLKNAELKFNFGDEPFKNQPKDGYLSMNQALDSHVVKSSKTGSAKESQVKSSSNAPRALIIEPSKELAEQTLSNVNQFKKYVDNPKLSRDLLIIGGVADGLLSAGYTDFIMRVYTRSHRSLQMISTFHGDFSCMDLKGEDSAPETVHHVVVPVNPKTDRVWERLGKNHIRVHIFNTCKDFTSFYQFVLQNALGKKLTSKTKKCSIFFCFAVINVTLPDEKQNYVHRIGRVGWVWLYHWLGKGCYNTRLKENLLSEIEEHLNCTITQCEPDNKVPVDEFDGKVTYGQRRTAGGGLYKGHVDILAPTVQELASLEREAQTSFLHLSYLPNQVFKAF
uniref:DEAD (Asp-Glu-Ala-Asp) box helicase 1 n=1 Tax=Cyprinus carpio TaxID=7962 RepID=A0A8C1TZU4_CYPCA